MKILNTKIVTIRSDIKPVLFSTSEMFFLDHEKRMLTFNYEDISI